MYKYFYSKQQKVKQKMGNMMGAIEAEEKELRLQEKRNDILQMVSELDDITTEEGLEDLAHYQQKYAKTYSQDGQEADDESSSTSKPKVVTELPWADLEKAEDRTALQKYCVDLAKKEDLLLKLEPQLAYQFDFELEDYVFLAHVLTKMDPGLGEAQLRLVPDEVSDAEFWRNFFYHIELWRKEHAGGNFENRLGQPKDEQARQAAVQEELRRANEEI